MFEYNLKHYAHIGDAVWELFVRENTAVKCVNGAKMHSLSVKYVNANFQAYILCELENLLSQDEKDIARRARNLKMTINKRNNPQIHGFATALEVLCGFWYINDKARLNDVFEIVKKYLND